MILKDAFHRNVPAWTVFLNKNYFLKVLKIINTPFTVFIFRNRMSHENEAILRKFISDKIK